MKKFNVVLVYNLEKDKILMCKREKEPYKGKFNLVGGKVEKDENELQAAYRELQEETGITKNDIILTHIMNFQYKMSDMELEVYAGKLNKHVKLIEELNKLYWIDKKENFFDIDRFAGEGNIGHMLKQVEIYEDKLFKFPNIVETDKVKVLFATTNPAKIKRYKKELEKRNIELITIKDIGINLHVKENGKNALENAYLKAKAYYDSTNLITIGMDNNLFIEELPKEKQPGTHVRRVNGKELTDEEMIEYYTNMVKEYGGKLTAKWVYGMVIYNGKETKSYSWSKSHFYFTDKPCKKRNPGYPLDSISIMPEYNKNFMELTEEERKDTKKDNNNDDVIKFIVSTIRNF